MGNVNRIVRLHVALGGLALGVACSSATESAVAQATVAQPPAVYAAPQRFANPYYSTSPAAANSAATLAEPHVVYPSAATNAVNAKGLPRDRVAALRAAVRVTTLDNAYRAGVAATDVDPTNEPQRFAPVADATQIPPANNVAVSAATRRDSAVQPVAWFSDASSTASAPHTPANATPNGRLAHIRAMPAFSGNPLRNDADDGPGNPLR